MDNFPSFEEDRSGIADDSGVVTAAADGEILTAEQVGNDERRMHVRAYNHWVSLLDGHPYPSIANLDPAGIADFGPHSVLLDFTAGIDDPHIAFLGRRLRDECGLDGSATRLVDVPGRSLLSRLTDHYLQIIANRAPVGFEAEFVNTRDRTTMYRGILMPFTSNGEQIDYIYGVINWKELAEPVVQTTLEQELATALAHAPAPAAVAPAPVWADGPGAEDHASAPATDADTLDGRLASARASAAEAASADGRSRTSLYEALGRAHDFAVATAEHPDGYEAILAAAGITVQARAPMTAVAKLVFGTDTDKARLTEFAAVLSHAQRVGVPTDALAPYLAATEGGMKAIVAIERAARRGDAPAAELADPVARVDAKPALATVQLPLDLPAGYVLLLGRVVDDAVEIVADVTETGALTRAIKRAA